MFLASFKELNFRNTFNKIFKLSHQNAAYFGKIRRNDQFTKKEDELEEEDEIISVDDIKIPRDKLEIRYARSSGPGGQNVNKVNSKAEVRFRVESADWLENDVKKRFIQLHKTYMNNFGEVIVTSQVGRDQTQNLEDAISKLRSMIHIASIPEKARKNDIPAETENEVKRRIDSKRKKSDVKKTRNSKFSDW